MKSIFLVKVKIRVKVLSTHLPYYLNKHKTTRSFVELS